MVISHRTYLSLLSVLFLAWWVVCAVAPYDRADWALENVLVALFAIAIALTYRSFPLSRISYTLIFLFLCLHELGAHFTYARVPYDDLSVRLVGVSINSVLGFERNHFDRLVHFCYGLLLAYPVREIFIRIADVRGFWAYFLPLDITMSTSAIFELFEWGAAELFGGDLGVAYLGTQGDIWDAHKDMALASLGALVAMVVTAFINRSLQRDFAAEWNESLRVKGRRPLGEDEIARMLRARRRREQKDR
jgi:putative membrane protein